MRYLIVLAVLAAQPLAAQEAFEISVYPYATAHRGEWELEGHLNYANRGTTAFDGSVAPRQGQVRFAGELTRGLTDHWEMSAYLLAAQVPTLGVRYAGWRLRSRFRAPEEWRLPVKMGLSIEYEATRPAFSESVRTFELTATLEHRIAGLQLLLGPTFERDLAGPEHSFEFEPKARAGLDVSGAVTLGVEYYGSLGELKRWHQVYPTADLRLGDDISLHLGVGFGGMTAGDRLVFKTAFEMPLGR
ncbi:MAG TPA: hypothetical protein VK113_01325 [Gemmatimonadales bacterium]|nr:hypothetical protein [Gemmatimonadales bacterium]